MSVSMETLVLAKKYTDEHGGTPTQEQVSTAVENYLTENPVSGMTVEEKEQLDKNTEDISSLSDEIINGTIFIDYAKGNLFELAEDIKNGYYSVNSSGKLIFNANPELSCFILKLKKSTKYVCTRSSYGVFLDSNKNPLSSNNWDLNNFVSFNSDNASYISITVNNSVFDEYVINYGSELDASALEYYIDWLMKNIYTKDECSSEISKNNSIITDEMKTSITSTEKNIKSGLIYFDYFVGNMINFATDQKEGYYYVKSEGKLIATANEDLYAFIIPVVKNSVYTCKNVSYIVLLNGDKQPVNAEGLWDEKMDNNHFNSGNASYVAVTAAVAERSKTCINIGNTSVEDLNYTSDYYIDWLMKNIYTKSEADNSFAKKDEILCNLPPVIYGVVGKELNVYFDNIVDGHDTDYDFDVTCDIGSQLDRVYRVVPSSSGQYPFSIEVSRGGDSKVFNSIIKIADKNAKSGVTKSVIVLGDSTTEQGYAMSTLYSVFEEDVMNIKLLGTNGTSPRNHEGHSGFSMATYFTNTDGNPFYNPETETFDAAYYFENSGIEKPDWFFINMGINDAFGYSNDKDLNLSFDNSFSLYRSVVDSVKQSSPSTKIGICITIPPNCRQEAFGVSYKCGQTQKRYKRNNILYVQRLIETFRDKDSENIYLVPLNINIDTMYNFGGIEKKVNSWNDTTYISFSEPDGVHPAESGCGQNADSYYFFLKNNA